MSADFDPYHGPQLEAEPTKEETIRKIVAEASDEFRKGVKYAVNHIWPYPIADTPHDWDTLKLSKSPHNIYCRGNDAMAEHIIKQKKVLLSALEPTTTEEVQ